MGANRLHIRSGTREDTTNVVTLLNQTFRTPIDAATWQWYVYGNPLGASRVYVADDAEGKLVGVIAFAPISLRLGGVSLRGDFAHHLVLIPAYRDTLSFVALNRHALAAQADLGVKLAVGPPNRTAYPIHKLIMKWVDFGCLECLRKLRPARQAHPCQETVRFGPEFDQFYSAVSRNLAFCVDKTAEWMNWRFSSRPGTPYTIYSFVKNDQLCGYVILKRWQDADGYRKAHILDMHAVDAASLSDLLRAAETYAADCDEINLWAVQGYVYRDLLETLGFTTNPAARQPFIARAYDGSTLRYPEGPSSFGYGDGDTLY